MTRFKVGSVAKAHLWVMSTWLLEDSTGRDTAMGQLCLGKTGQLGSFRIEAMVDCQLVGPAVDGETVLYQLPNRVL